MQSCIGTTTEPFLFLQTGCFMVNTLILPQLLQDRVCRNLFNSTVCDTLSTNRNTPHVDHIQNIASWWLSVIIPSSSVLTMISICFIGPLSDIVEKRKVMCAVPISTLIQAVLLMILSKVTGQFHPAWLFLPMLIPSLMGSTQGALLLALAYKADTTDRSEQTRIMARTEGFFFLAVAYVGLISEPVLKERGYIVVVVGTAILSIINILYVVLVLPDEKGIIKRDEEKAFVQNSYILGEKVSDDPYSQVLVPKGRMSSLLKLQQIRKVFTTKPKGHSIAMCVASLLAALFSIQGLFFISAIYFSHPPFNLRNNKLGYFMAFTATMVSFGCWFMVPLLQHFARFDDTGLLISGYLATTVILILYRIANASWMVYVFTSLALLSCIPLPVSRSMITKHVSGDLHGSSLAIAGVMDVAVSTANIFISTFINSEAVSIYPAIVIIMLLLVGMIALIFIDLLKT